MKNIIKEYMQETIQTKRNFIGIEIDEKYFNIAKDRIEERIKEKDTQLNIFDMLGEDIK